jgi:hypothetical protein
VRGGAPTREAAEHLARKLRDILRRRHEEERVGAELDSHRVPLDLNALIPIPRSVLRKGFVEAGQEWMWANWGVRWPIRRVSFAVERSTSGGKLVAVFRFLSEDWSPWIALLHMRERWPELRFKMIPSYLHSDLKWRTGALIMTLGGGSESERKRPAMGAPLFPFDRTDADLVAHLSGLNARGILIIYFNWMSRLVKPQPREVRKSKAFEQNPIVAARASDFAQIIGDIEIGSDLKRYLSRGVEIAADLPGKKRRDLDLMLNDWGVHHLHISTQAEADGYVKRDGPLVFAIFRPPTAYLIDVMSHKDWTRGHVLDVLATEWPEEGIIHELRGVHAGRHTDEERAALRKNHLTTIFEHGGRVFMPSGGLTLGGTAIGVTMGADKLLSDLEYFEEHFIAHPERLQEAFKASGIRLPDEPVFEFAIREDGYGVIETTTRGWINLYSVLAPVSSR